MIHKVKHLVTRYRRRRAERRALSEPTDADAVRITNETVAARREEVLGSARKYIYPLQASKHRVVKLSAGVFVVAVAGFFIVCTLELYKFQSTASFIYGVTRVLPFPVAVIDTKHFVSYDSYLFELRHYMHYYETQQHVDFSSKDGKKQLAIFKERTFDQVLQNAYTQILADQNNISISDHDIDVAVALVRSQDRLGASDQVFRSVLNEFWGWSEDDFRRELSEELLAQKVIDKLDTQTHDRAGQALAQLQSGADFGTVAKQVSDDLSTQANGGVYATLIDRSNPDIAPQVADELFKLQPGQYSGIINTGYTLEIVKVIGIQGNQVRAAHISFNFQPITKFTDPLQAKEKPYRFIKV